MLSAQKHALTALAISALVLLMLLAPASTFLDSAEALPGTSQPASSITGAAEDPAATPEYLNLSSPLSPFADTASPRYALAWPTDCTGSPIELKASDAGRVLEPRKVYTVTRNTEITAKPGENGLVVSPSTNATNPAVLFIPAGVTLTVTGSKGTPSSTVGKAAIRLNAGNVLYVRGAGTLIVKGGAGIAPPADAFNYNPFDKTPRSGDGRYGFSLGTLILVNGFFSGEGGAASGGGSGGGAAIGTDGADGGKPVLTVGESIAKKQYFTDSSQFAISGMPGSNGFSGADSATSGLLYVLDTVTLDAAGGAGGTAGAGAKGTGIEVGAGGGRIRVAGGGGGGAAGRGGTGAPVGSGGAGGGSGGSGGSGGITRKNSGEINGYATGGGGGGGYGARLRNDEAVPAPGSPPDPLFSVGGGGTAWGGKGGTGGAAGKSALGGQLYVAPTATLQQSLIADPDDKLNERHPVHGNPSTLHDLTVEKNSQYALTFAPNEPSGARYPIVINDADPNPITVTAGVNWNTDTDKRVTATLVGFDFLGWYTQPVGGVQVLDQYGCFKPNVGKEELQKILTLEDGSWCAPADMTLYAHWEPRVFRVSLNMATAVEGAKQGSPAVFEKYARGWFADFTAQEPLDPIQPPRTPGYDFLGYFSEIEGGSMIINPEGKLQVSNYYYEDNITLYAHWHATPYPVRVSVTLDGAPYAGRTLEMYHNGLLRHTLKEQDPGVYHFFENSHGDSRDGVGIGSYDLYLDGAYTGRSVKIVPDAAGNLNIRLDYRTAHVAATLDGVPSEIGEVTLRQDGVTRAHLAYNSSDAEYQQAVLLGADNSYDVYIDNVASGDVLSLDKDPADALVTIPYYRARFLLSYNSPWTNATVTLRSAGQVRHFLGYHATQGNTVEYQAILRGDTSGPGAGGGAGANPDAYDIFLNGSDTGCDLLLNAEGLANGKTVASDAYYAVEVAVQKDNAPWSSTGVMLYNGALQAYTLSYDPGTHRYHHRYVHKLPGDAPYSVHVSGTTSPAAIGQTVNAQNPHASAAYYTVSYTDGATPYLTQVFFAGAKAHEPGAPYHPGKTFSGWCVGSAEGAAYHFNDELTGPVSLYASYGVPRVIIGGYMKTNEQGNVDGAGGYYRMVNLTITGYPLTGAPMLSATLSVENGSVSIANLGPYELHDNIDVSSHNGMVSIVFGAVSVTEMERFLRNEVIVKVEDTALDHDMQVSIYGNTN
jgi:hypothetical protein